MKSTDSGTSIGISGFGCICASGSTAVIAAENVMRGLRPYSYEKGVQTTQGTTFPVFPIDDSWLPDNYKSLAETKRCGELALIAVREALDMAGLTVEDLKGRRVGICLGTTAGNALNNDPFYPQFRSGSMPSSGAIMEYRSALPTDYLARRLGIKARCQTITNACSSGAVAIGEGMSWIEGGLCDLVIAGGSEKLCPVICNGFASLLIADTKPCKPFDVDRNGLNLGEGSGIVILESVSSIDSRKGTCFSRLVGYGNRSDAYHMSAPKPEGTGLRSAIQDALSMSGLDIADMAFINAHGTGTVENDAMEAAVFGEMAPETPYFSVKGCTGHSLGAAGAIEAVLTIIFLNGREIPGTAGLTTPLSDSGRPVTVSQSVTGGYAITNSIGFGGNCGVLILGRGDL